MKDELYVKGRIARLREQRAALLQQAEQLRADINAHNGAIDELENLVKPDAFLPIEQLFPPGTQITATEAPLEPVAPTTTMASIGD